MTLHRFPRADLEVALVQIVRSGEHIDKLEFDGDDCVVITEDRIETRRRVWNESFPSGGAA